VNDPLNLPLCTPEDRAIFEPFEGAFGDETLWNYEAGVKSSFAGITLNAAAYYTDISDLQVTLDAGSCSSRIVFNVPEAHTMGVELELGASPIDGLDLSVATSWTEAEFDSSLPGLETTTGIREGNRLPSVPKFQIAASAFYSFPIDEAAGTEAFVGATFQHVGSRFTQPSDQENNPRGFVHDLAPFIPAGSVTTVDLKLPSYELFNISAGVDFDNGFGLTAYVNNVFDENPLLSFDRERGGRARLAYQVGQPRTYGLTLRKRFGGAPTLAAPPPPPPPPLPLETPTTQTCPDGTMVLASEPCPPPPPPPPPPPQPGERG
jgi:iron complex outermembrane recepter protein